jgi:putative FmdB family regulatory protein
MPTYEYECKSCSRRFEVFQSMSDEPIKKCPECGKAVRRLVSGGVGVIFKGSGFYVTDAAPKKAASKTVNKTEAAPKADTGDAGSKGDTGSTGDAVSKEAPKAASKGKAKPAA